MVINGDIWDINIVTLFIPPLISTHKPPRPRGQKESLDLNSPPANRKSLEKTSKAA